MRKCISLLSLLILSSFFLFGLYLRIESILETKVTHHLVRDDKDYYMYSYNLRHHHIYSKEVVSSKNSSTIISPDAVRTPGYPLFLLFFVDDLPNEKIINKILISHAILSTLTLLFAFFFFQGFLPIYWSAPASLLVALCPHLIVANSYILTETFFCYLMIMVGIVINFFVSKPSYKSAFIMGIALAMASLTRPSIQYLPIVISLFFISNWGKRKGLNFLVSMLLGFALVFSPWIIRNIITLKKTTDNRQMIVSLQHGMYPDFTFDNVPESYGFPYSFDPRTEEISKDVTSVLKEISRRFRHEPLKHLKWFILKKPVAFWAWNLVQGGDVFSYSISKSPYFSNKYFQWTHQLMRNLHWPIVLSCFLGCLAAWLPLTVVNLSEKSIIIARFTSTILIYFTLVHMIVVPLPRYSIPLRPFMYGMACYTPYLLIVFANKYLKTATQQ
jgi:hypothetical protein